MTLAGELEKTILFPLSLISSSVFSIPSKENFTHRFRQELLFFSENQASCYQHRVWAFDTFFILQLSTFLIGQNYDYFKFCNDFHIILIYGDPCLNKQMFFSSPFQSNVNKTKIKFKNAYCLSTKSLSGRDA